jgi:hypothetical protein
MKGCKQGIENVIPSYHVGLLNANKEVEKQDKKKSFRQPSWPYRKVQGKVKKNNYTNSNNFC